MLAKNDNGVNINYKRICKSITRRAYYAKRTIIIKISLDQGAFPREDIKMLAQSV